MKLSTHLKAIETDLKAVDEFRDVDIDVSPGRFDVAEIERNSFRTPALRIAFLGAPRTNPKADGTRQYDAAWAVFVMTDGQDRAVEGTDLTEKVAERIELNRFSDQAAVMLPENVRMDALYTGNVDDRGVSLFAVSWTQKIRIGQSHGLATAEDPQAVIQNGIDLTETIDITILPKGHRHG